MELAKSCKGLPLSIVVLGGILAKKEKSIQIWSKFKDCVTSYITDGRTTPCLEILALSYNHLPLDLKPCFLYLGMFPEDYEIATQDLIRLWISERFVHQIGNRKVIDVAEDYLEELIDRSLIQVARRGSDGSVERCRIHDLLRDLCIKVSGQEKLFDVHSEANLSSPIKPRRLSVNCNPTRYTISQNACDTSSTRSLLFFCQDGDFLKNQWEWICKGFNFVRVLRLSDVRGTSPIPKEIEKLVFLRHLSLNNYIGEIMFHGEKVPDYICSLPYLETLELQCENSLTFSQKSISRMKQLRYIDVGMGFRILADVGQRERGSGNVDMDTLPNLQCVQSIVVDRHTASFLAKFPNLTELSLFGNSEEALASLEKNLRHLQRLDLRHFCDYLHLEVLPSTLTKVTLYDSAGPNMMKTLAKLPNLLHLHIQNRIGSAKNLDLRVAAGEFPQLLVLELIQSSINSWKMERDGMPNLRRLIITDIDGNIQVPDQVWFLRVLRFVKIEMDTNISAESFRNKLWELNYVKEEIVDEFKSHMELTLKNGCKVSLSGVEHLFHQFR